MLVGVFINDGGIGNGNNRLILIVDIIVYCMDEYFFLRKYN